MRRVPGGGPAGPKGDTGDEGPYYDEYKSVSGKFSDDPYDPTSGGGYFIKFSDSSGRIGDFWTDNLKGATGPSQDIPERPDDQWKDEPWVHKGTGCQKDESKEEVIYGKKTFAERIRFNGECSRHLVDFTDNMALHTEGNVKVNSSTTSDFIRIYNNTYGAKGKGGINIGVRNTGSAQVGIKVEKPQMALEAKGHMVSNSFSAVGTDYYDNPSQKPEGKI